MTAGVRGLEGSIASIAGFRAPRRAAPVVCEGLGGGFNRGTAETERTGADWAVSSDLAWLGCFAACAPNARCIYHGKM
jgi:hypothetical protein